MVFSNRSNCSEPCEFRTDYAAVSSICFGLLNRYLCFSIPHPAKFHKRIYKLLQHMHIRTYTTNRHTCCATRAVPHVLCRTCCAARLYLTIPRSSHTRPNSFDLMNPRKTCSFVAPYIIADVHRYTSSSSPLRSKRVIYKLST